MKKRISVVLCFVLCLTFLSGMVPAGALAEEGESSPDIDYIEVTEEKACEISSVDYTNAHGSIIKENGRISFQPSHWTEYDVWVNKAGNYSFYVKYGSPGGLNLTISLNGKSVATPSLASTGTGNSAYFSGKVEHAVSIGLTEGLNTIKVSNRGGYAYFDSLIIEYFKDVEVSEILTEDGFDILASDIKVSRGADSFKIKLSQKVNEDEINEENIKLIDAEGNEIPLSVSKDGDYIVLALKKTLDYDKQYSFSLNGISDIYGFSSLENESFSFVTTEGDSGMESASLNILETKFEGKQIYIKTEMMSKAGIPIEGRMVGLFGNDIKGNPFEAELYLGYSGKNGITEIEGELPQDSVSGVYELFLAYEYAEADILIEMVYVTEDDEKALIQELKDADSTETIIEFFNENYKLFGLKPGKDMENIDAEKVYEYFKEDKPDSIKELINSYYTYLAMEKINQAETKDEVKEVIEDEKLCSYIGISSSKAVLVVNEKDWLLDKILNLDEIKDKEKFKTALSIALEDAFAKENHIEKINAQIEDVSCYEGQVAVLNLQLEETADSVTSVKFVLLSEDKSIFDDCEIVADSAFYATIKDLTNGIEILFAADAPQNSVCELGKLNINKTDVIKIYKVLVGGEISYYVGSEEEVKTFFDETKIEISVSDNNEKAEGRPVSRPTSGRGLGGGSTAVYNPIKATAAPTEEPTPAPTETPKAEPTETPDAYKFEDTDKHVWANEAIEKLLEKGVISKSEDNKFYPDRNVKRAEFVKMIMIAFELFEKGDKADFSDVTENMWYYEYAASAQKHEIITGNEEKMFSGDENITREDMAVILKRVCDKKGYGFSGNDFKVFDDDAQISHYAKEAVYKMQMAKIINGVGEDNFAPRDFATRAQAAKIIYETVKAVGEND